MFPSDRRAISEARFTPEKPSVRNVPTDVEKSSSAATMSERNGRDRSRRVARPEEEEPKDRTTTPRPDPTDQRNEAHPRKRHPETAGKKSNRDRRLAERAPRLNPRRSHERLHRAPAQRRRGARRSHPRRRVSRSVERPSESRDSPKQREPPIAGEVESVRGVIGVTRILSKQTAQHTAATVPHSMARAGALADSLATQAYSAATGSRTRSGSVATDRARESTLSRATGSDRLHPRSAVRRCSASSFRYGRSTIATPGALSVRVHLDVAARGSMQALRWAFGSDRAGHRRKASIFDSTFARVSGWRSAMGFIIAGRWDPPACRRTIPYGLFLFPSSYAPRSISAVALGHRCRRARFLTSVGVTFPERRFFRRDRASYGPAITREHGAWPSGCKCGGARRSYSASSSIQAGFGADWKQLVQMGQLAGAREKSSLRDGSSRTAPCNRAAAW